MMSAATAPEAPAEKSKSGAPSRNYVVLEQDAFENGDLFYVEVHRVEARNHPNAMRKAYRELAADRSSDEAVLVCVPESQWKPTKVAVSRRQDIRVAIGESS